MIFPAKSLGDLKGLVHLRRLAAPPSMPYRRKSPYPLWDGPSTELTNADLAPIALL